MHLRLDYKSVKPRRAKYKVMPKEFINVCPFTQDLEFNVLRKVLRNISNIFFVG